jgi:hypothetical protein
VRRSPRKSVPSRKALESNQIRIERLSKNPKAYSVDRNDQLTALKSILVLNRASWDDDIEFRKQRWKIYYYDSCRDDDIYPLSVKLTS